jgi:hypothetical protein
MISIPFSCESCNLRVNQCGHFMPHDRPALGG